MVMKTINQFIRKESLGGILLFFFACLAFILDNTPWHYYYEAFLHFQMHIGFGDHIIQLPILEWINQGLMTFFFLLVGLEIKREMVVGELDTPAKRMLPAIAALGGMIVPALIYTLLNWNNLHALKGWAIPTATDIAFALAVLSLLHHRVPMALKIFLTALAIFDDLGAIIIIAVFYSNTIAWFYLSLALIGIILLLLLNHFNCQKLWPYLLIGIFIWFDLLNSGIHAVIAGVILALTIPVTGSATQPSPLKKLESYLHPWVAFLILPLFGFANAGVAVLQANWHDLFNSVSWGILLGLFFGKQVGVFASTWLAIKLHWAPKFERCNWPSIYAVAVICGIGFTMSLFIGTLAFTGRDAHFAVAVRLGVILGSLLSGLFGYILLTLYFPKDVHHEK